MLQQTGCTHLIYRKVILDDGDSLARSDSRGFWSGFDSEHLAAMAPEAVEPGTVVSANIKNEVVDADVAPEGDVSDDFSEGGGKPRALFRPKKIVEVTVVGFGEFWEKAVSAGRAPDDFKGPAWERARLILRFSKPVT